MPNTRYRRGGLYAADMAVYTRQMAADSSQEVSRLKRNLLLALREDVTQRQRQMMELRYFQGLSIPQIAQELHVNKSTVSRTTTKPSALSLGR